MEKRWLWSLVTLLCRVAAISELPCPECPCMRWTPWINADDPSGFGDYETLRFPKPGYGTYITDGNGKAGNVARKLWNEHKMTCNHPIEIECRDVKFKKPFHLSGDDTKFPYSVKCTTDHGLICVNSEQKDGACVDYEVRLLCWTPCNTLLWMAWSDRDDPTGTGDYEGHQLADHPSRNYEPCPAGSSPYEIECQRIVGSTNALVSGQKNLTCDRNWGFTCLNADNSCHDYRVRYLCRV